MFGQLQCGLGPAQQTVIGGSRNPSHGLRSLRNSSGVGLARFGADAGSHGLLIRLISVEPPNDLAPIDRKSEIAPLSIMLNSVVVWFSHTSRSVNFPMLRNKVLAAVS